jgi:hypothetical protein
MPLGQKSIFEEEIEKNEEGRNNTGKNKKKVGSAGT